MVYTDTLENMADVLGYSSVWRRRWMIFENLVQQLSMAVGVSIHCL